MLGYSSKKLRDMNMSKVAKTVEWWIGVVG